MERSHDLESSLAEIDRRLRELQRELQVVAGREGAERARRETPEPAPPEPPPEPPPGPGPDAARLVDDTAERVAELGRRLEELQRLGAELEDATRALQDELARGGGSGRAATWNGDVVVRAGPFPNIASLGEFERALGRLPGAEDAYVRSFAGDWALLEVRLRGDVDLVDEIRREVSPDVRVVDSGPGELEIALGP